MGDFKSLYLETMKILLVIMCLYLASCFSPERGGYYDFRYVQLAEINKDDRGYELVWIGGLGEEYRTWMRDTACWNLQIGMAYLSILKK